MLKSSKQINSNTIGVETVVQSAVVATSVATANVNVPALGNKLQLINPSDINSVENLGKIKQGKQFWIEFGTLNILFVRCRNSWKLNGSYHVVIQLGHS